MKAIPDKVRKYHIARLKGHNKNQARDIAGYSSNTLPLTVENSIAYKSISYKDTVLQQTSLETLAREQLKIVMQDKDLGAKNTAIKNVIDKLEPNNQIADIEDKLVIVLG